MWLFLLLFACVSNCLQQSIIIDSVRKSELEITEPYIKLNPNLKTSQSASGAQCHLRDQREEAGIFQMRRTRRWRAGHRYGSNIIVNLLLERFSICVVHFKLRIWYRLKIICSHDDISHVWQFLWSHFYIVDSVLWQSHFLSVQNLINNSGQYRAFSAASTRLPLRTDHASLAFGLDGGVLYWI